MKPRRRNIEEKETHGKRLSSQDPQQPSRGVDPSRNTVKRRLGQLERKGQEKKIRNRAKNTSAKKPSDLLWHKQKASRGTRIEKYEKENGNRRLSSWQNRILPRWEKRGKVELPNGETEKGIPQHIPKKDTNQGLSKESKQKEGKNEKNGK